MKSQWFSFLVILLASGLVLGTIACGGASETAEETGEGAAENAAEAADATTDTALGGSCADKPYEVNPDASPDLIENTTSFLRCTSGDYALCYYSGADPLPCTYEESLESAACQCQVFTASDEEPMYVLMSSILNLCIFDETVEQCGEDGSRCFNICNDHPDSPQCSGSTLPAEQMEAVVCDYIDQGTFDREAAYISTFSFAKVSPPDSTDTFGLGCKAETGRYAGCMTASCNGVTTDGIGNTYVDCDCPVFPAATDATADYQFGRHCNDSTGDDSTGNCELSEGQVWSAAYNPEGCPGLPIPPHRSGDGE